MFLQEKLNLKKPKTGDWTVIPNRGIIFNLLTMSVLTEPRVSGEKCCGVFRAAGLCEAQMVVWTALRHWWIFQQDVWWEEQTWMRTRLCDTVSPPVDMYMNKPEYHPGDGGRKRRRRRKRFESSCLCLNSVRFNLSLFTHSAAWNPTLNFFSKNGPAAASPWRQRQKRKSKGIKTSCVAVHSSHQSKTLLRGTRMCLFLERARVFPSLSFSGVFWE